MPWPDPNSVATIYANNMKFTAWESLMVQRAYGEGVSTFQFAAAEKVYGPGAQSLQIAPGDPVTIALAGQTILTGYCTMRSGAFDGKSANIVISGVSRTFDLAHSSVLMQPGTFDGSGFGQAAQAAMTPQGISLTIVNPPDGADQSFTHLVAQPGETIAEFVSRIAAARNLFITDDVNGNLVAGHANPSAGPIATIAEGANLLSCSFKIADPSSYSWAKLQNVSQTAGSDDAWPSRAYSATASYSAARPNLYRYFIAEHPSNTQELVTGLTHQAILSAWPEIEIEATVAGWLRPDGKLWATAPDDGYKVSFYSPRVFPSRADPTNSAVLGIQGVRFGQDSQNGTTTALTLRRWELLTHAGTADVGDTGSLPSVSPDSPDYKTST